VKYQRGVFPAFLIQPLLWLALIAALAAGAMWAKTSYDETRRDEGRAEVQAKWDDDKAMRIRRTTEITLTLSGKLMEAKDAQTRRETEINARFSTLEARVRALGSGRTVGMSPAAADLLRDAADAANRANARALDDRTETRPDPVPAAAQTVAFDEQEFVAWIVKAGAAYADAVNLWQAARGREDALRDTLETLRKEVGP
jgi:hypothetical protein